MEKVVMKQFEQVNRMIQNEITKEEDKNIEITEGDKNNTVSQKNKNARLNKRP